MQLKYIILGFFVCALVVFFSLSEHTAPTPTVPYLDKLIHFVGYGLLTLFSFILFAEHKMRALSVAGLILLALGTEGLQLFVAGRTASLQDLLANFAGIFMGALTGLALCWIYKHCKSPKALSLSIFNYLRKL